MNKIILILALVVMTAPAWADDYDYGYERDDGGLQTYDQYFGIAGDSSGQDREQYRVYDHGHGNMTIEDERGNREVIRVYDHGNGNVTVEKR